MEKETEIEKFEQFLSNYFDDNIIVINRSEFIRSKFYLNYEIIDNVLFFKADRCKVHKLSQHTEDFIKKYTIWKRKQKLKSLNNL